MSTLCFKGVSLQFIGAAEPALQDCTFEVESGQFTVILGPSGCGKTTLLKLVNRLYEPTSGQIYLTQQDIRQQPVTALRRRMGYVIQQSGLFPHMTVAQNIAVVPRLLGWSGTRTQARVDELLALVGLPSPEYRDRYPAQLSGGQQQRVGIARALAGEPDLLLMDEPFGALDAIARAHLQDEILRLQRQLQKTVLFVSHDVDEALRLADRILVLHSGRVVQYDTPFNLLRQPANDFVRHLIGADDMVRQLSRIRVEAAMSQLPAQPIPQHQPAIAPHESLRQALSLLLRTGSPQLTVTDQGVPVGFLNLEHIRAAALPPTRPQP